MIILIKMITDMNNLYKIILMRRYLNFIIDRNILEKSKFINNRILLNIIKMLILYKIKIYYYN